MARPSAPHLTSAAVACATGAGLVVLALAQGGYDIVDRQTAAVVLWWLVGLAAVISSRRPQAPELTGALVTAFAAGIAIWIGVSVGQSTSQERTVVELGRAVAHLAPVALIGWALPARWWNAVLAGLIAGAVLVCIAAFGNRLSPGFLGQTTAIVFANTTSRLAAPLGYWNAVGSWGVITTLLLLAVGSHAPRWWVRAAAMAWVPLATTVVYLTYSRSSLGAAVFGGVVLVALSQRRWTVLVHLAASAAAGLVVVLAVRGQPQIADATGTAGAGAVLAAVALAGLALAIVAAVTGRVGLDRVAMPLRAARIGMAVGVVAVIAGAGAGIAAYGGEAWDKFSTREQFSSTVDPTERLGSLNNGSRVAQWQVALDSWKREKARGSGAGTFELTYNTQGTDGQFVRDAHSAFLEALSEQGTLGLLLLVGLVLSMAAAVVTAARRVADPLARGLVAGAAAGLGAFLFGTGFDWFWEVTALAMFAMALAGVIVAAGKRDVSTSAPASARGGWVLRGGLVAVALVAVLVELPGLVGTSEVRRSQREVSTGNITEARSHADQAIDILPWASSPFLQRGLVDEQAGEWESAREALQLAIRRDPLDWRLPLVLSRIEAESGEPEAALAAYRQAKKLRPGGQFFR